LHLDFRIDATKPELRHLAVSLEFDVAASTTNGSARSETLFLPAWTPGSYLNR
jgi:hypothetical protein